jgi:hypothetical protein
MAAKLGHMAQICFRVEMNCVLLRLDYGDCNTQPSGTAILKIASLQLRVLRDI